MEQLQRLAEAIADAYLRNRLREHGKTQFSHDGKTGEPEIFKAINGSQYMIPGDNGSVMSNKDIGNAGGGNVIHQEVNFHITTTGGIDAATQKQLAGMMKQVALFQMKKESTRGGGMLQPRQKK
ncbi:hypothetical protein [Mixta calida]|uniref:hypothetical protein n=1 Tax=Mixta calida TaxID=665913 RepID=UPI0034D682C3